MMRDLHLPAIVGYAQGRPVLYFCTDGLSKARKKQLEQWIKDYVSYSVRLATTGEQ